MEFSKLPFTSRPDLSPYLIHLTRRADAKSGYMILQQILWKDRCLKGSNHTGFIKGSTPAVCFMDIPFFSLKYLLSKRNAKNYEPYGIFINKEQAYLKGTRPVSYVSADEETNVYKLDKAEKWRLVKLDVNTKMDKNNPDWTCWAQEREWRCPNEYKFDNDFEFGVLVKTVAQADKFLEICYTKGHIKPIAVIPLEVICQGLDYTE